MSWESQLRDFKAKTKAEAEKQFRAAVLQIMTAVIMDTPVLEGRLRGDWEAFLGTYTKGAGRLTSVDTTGTLTVEACRQMVMSAHLDDLVYFVNSMPYAARVEFDGWSHTKAPEGMLRKNLLRWKNAVEGGGNA